MNSSGNRLIMLCIFLAAFPTLAFSATTHKIRKNESLYSLAKKYHVSVQDLRAANNLVNNNLKPGDKLIIPSRNLSSADDGPERGKFKGSCYRIRKGDNLAGIARKTGLTVAELKRINGIVDKKLKPGRVLRLRDEAPVEVAAVRKEKSYQTRNRDLFTSEEYERTLAELTDNVVEKPVELGENLGLMTDASKQLKKSAFSFLGTRYRFGGNSRSGLDCSGFVQHVFRELNINLPRTAREQYWVGEPVVPYDLQKGDLVFFRTYAPYPSHVGIYLGENKMIHASSRDHKVVISSLNTPYYRSRFIGAKRHPKLNPETMRLEDLLSEVDVSEEGDDDALRNDTLGLQVRN